MKLSEYEIKALLESPVALQVLIDCHDYQVTCADAMDMAECVSHHEKRIIELKSIKKSREQLEKEWSQ